MLRIPFIPTAYPDETLGSLLTRLVVYNDVGLWRTLLLECGFGYQRVSNYFTIPRQDHRLDKLLHFLGYTHREMLDKLTTLPFWLAFNNAVRPKDRIVVDNENFRGTFLGRVRNDLEVSGARYCPTCLVEDLITYGEPYLHRGHQLPVSIVCYRHGDWLRISCPACGIAVLPLANKLIRPASLKCECGHDLTVASRHQGQRQQYLQRLSQFAQSTLSCDHSPWDMRQVQVVLQSNATSNGLMTPAEILRILKSAYGPIEVSPSGVIFRLREQHHQDVDLRLRAKAIMFRAPEYCALFCAMGVTFEQFKKMVLTVPNDFQSDLKKPRLVAGKITIEMARSEYDRFSAQYSGQHLVFFQRHSARCYWLLRLKDEKWLRKRGNETLRRIRSVDSDRATVQPVLLDIARSNASLLNGGPWIRTTIRDKTWLNAQLSERLKKEKTLKAEVLKNSKRDREIVLSRAIFTVLRLERRPVDIDAVHLSKVTKISLQKTRKTIYSCPQLQVFISAVNAGKRRRTAEWAARELVAYQGLATASEVLAFARLHKSRVNRRFAIDALVSLGVL